ncbi:MULTISPECIES: YdcF family protein [unclassified Rhodococcus (in: high G+C Gram-positive bacteria)]|uniref:YdcF family protein n=1 Tax=unclassified Rhodococcus (in: high G+C Gram-positive bacteria) TaxID=192944 RepID=UPI001C9B51C4|nr:MULTISPECIES: YdcF family protein [unclassified Rhodococcus (in: high G+C Gram-positive bacteria)]MBY6678757.1 YdcF family protein [Rhodococcus sp. BP-332]
MSWTVRLALVMASLVVAGTVGLGASGYVLFTRAAEDPVTSVDAIIVLGGEHDGREEYGLDLARSGVADTVVLSDPYNSRDRRMAAWCASGTATLTVLCPAPVPSTTRGEAIFTQRLAQQYGWSHVMVISWRYHLPRARYIFGQCFSGEVTMRAVPRSYAFSLADWEYTYLYQVAGFVKARAQGTCTDVSQRSLR